jgi:hypothetical protein
MAQYVVIQDIEAEDKFVGPLTLRQFIFAGVTVILLYLCFIVVTKGLWPAVIVFFPPALISGFLAFPWGRDQPTEIWLLARLRFLFKPHQRIWDQAGLQQLVTITAPKKIVVDLTNGLDATQVSSRLEALAHTLDTRGWALKGVEVNMNTAPAFGTSSDRLVSASTLPAAQTPVTTIRSSDDMLDMQNNPAAAQMAQMAQANEAAHRQALMDKMDQIRAEQQSPSSAASPAQTTTSAPASTPVAQPGQATPASAPATPMPEPPKPAILELASNDDLSVATIARQANKAQSGDNEVVISLR